MSVTIPDITHAVNTFTDIPDVTFATIDISQYGEDVQIFTNTPAVQIPGKLNAVMQDVKEWLNVNVSDPLENQQNTFKNEVVVRTNTAMQQVEDYLNNEVKVFVNTIFIPWANDAGQIMEDHTNLLETNITTHLSGLESDYSAHVAQLDQILNTAILDFQENLANYTTGASDSGYTVRQVNELLAENAIQKPLEFKDQKYNIDGNLTYVKEGNFQTTNITYDGDNIKTYGEILTIETENRPFSKQLYIETDDISGSTQITHIKTYSIFSQRDGAGELSYRVTGAEADGTAALDLTVLNETSIADVDNPQLTLVRGRTYAFTPDGVEQGDLLGIQNVDNTEYFKGIWNNYIDDGDNGTILFSAGASFCHDKFSSLTGFGVNAEDGAIALDNDGNDYDNPLACEGASSASVALINDLTRSYDTDPASDTYVSAISDGLIYDVYIQTDIGVLDTFSYTVDNNGHTGTGAICASTYDNGVSDVTITNGGSYYSANTFAYAYDLGAGTNATCSAVTDAGGTIQKIDVTNGGADYTSTIRVHMNGDHLHYVDLTLAQWDQIQAGTTLNVTSPANGTHTHTFDIAIDADGYVQFQNMDLHEHGVDFIQYNPDIVVDIAGGTGAVAEVIIEDGVNISGLSVDGVITSIIVKRNGSGYSAGDVVSFTGGTPTTSATATTVVGTGGVASISVNTPGSGYSDNTGQIVNIVIDNNSFSPSQTTVKVGDTIRWTNNDITQHKVQSKDGYFMGPLLSQGNWWDMLITRESQIVEMAEIFDALNTSITSEVFIRPNTVMLDVTSNNVNAGGCIAKGQVDSSGGLVNVVVVEQGFGYHGGTTTISVIDTNGAGEGAAGTPILNRSLGAVSLTNGGSGYSDNVRAVVRDPVGALQADGSMKYGAGAVVDLVVEAGVITSATVKHEGSDYKDIVVTLFDETGTGAVLTPDFKMQVQSITMDRRGESYADPQVAILDNGGVTPFTNELVVGSDYAGSATLNNGIGSIAVVDGWHDYVDGSQRVVVWDADANPTGYGAEGTAVLNAQGGVVSVTITNPGSAYKSPEVAIAGPVLIDDNTAINFTNTPLTLEGPEGNVADSPFSAPGATAAGTSYRNGVQVIFANSTGHTVGDNWTFKCMSWTLGTPANLKYESIHYDGDLNQASGLIKMIDALQETTEFNP